jgi:integral membrane protein
MNRYLHTTIGRLRAIAFLEGISLILLVFVGMPVKHLAQEPFLVQAIGPVHGVLFLFFVLYAIIAAVEYRWTFRTTTWKVLLACLIPFGTFYIDKTVLRKTEAGGMPSR